MYCPKLYADYSVTGNSHMQDVIRREWHALFKDDNAADGCFPSRPKGSPQIPQSGVACMDAGEGREPGCGSLAVLGKGGAIPSAPASCFALPPASMQSCELRLVLGDLGASIIYIQFRTVH